MKKLFLFLLSFIPILSFAQGVYQSTGDLRQTGNYPIIWGKNAKGVPQSRATKAQMLAIPTSFRDTSMTCYVIETDSTYRLQQDLVTWITIAPGNIAKALSAIKDSLSSKVAALSTTYIKNLSTGTQTASYNINGSGTAKNLALSGTDGSGNLYLPAQTAKPSAPASGVKVYSQNGLAWETPNGFSRTLNWPSIAADHVATFIDASGTVPFLESDQTWSGINTFGTNPIIKNTTPALTLTETSTNYSTTLSKSSTLNTLSLTHQLYQAGGQGSAILFTPTVAQYGRSTDAGLPSGNSPFSVSFFINNNSASTGNGQSIIGWGNATNFISIKYFSNPKIVVFNGTTALASFTMPSNTGYHQVLITYNGSTVSGYIDNILIGNTTANISTVLGGANSFFIGNAINNSTNPFNGELDEVVIWNKALTRTSGTGVTIDEVSANWSNGYGTPSPPSVSNIIRRYTFDEGSGSTALDIGSNATNLSLINTPVYDLNGKVAKSGNIQNGIALSFSDGINNSEKGQWMFGDTQGGTILQGRSIRHLINGYYPFLQGLDGHMVLDPAITISSPDINGSYNALSILKIGGGTAAVAPLQFTSGTNNTTPLPGSLEYNGAFSFTDATNSRYSFVGLEKNQTFTGMNTYQGTLNASGGIARGLYINNTLQATANNDNLISLDITGSQSTTGGTALSTLGSITPGSGYVNGTYNNVALTGGTGTGGLANIIVSGGGVTSVTLVQTSLGSGYTVGDVLSASNISLGSSGSGFLIPVTAIKYSGVAFYSIRHASPIIPSVANSASITLGTSTLYYSRAFAATTVTNGIQFLNNGFTFANTAGGVIGAIGNTTGNFTWGSSVDGGFKFDVVSNGNQLATFRSTGIIQNTATTSLGNLFSTTINPLVNNQTLIGADFNFTFGTGASSLPTGVIPASNYSVSVAPTAAGPVSVAQAATNGSGTGASFTVFTTVGGVASIQVTNGGSGYAVGNTVTLVANGGTMVYTIPVGGVGLSNINTFAARFSNKISLTPTTLTSTPLANAVENDGANLYLTNSSGTRNQFAYTASPSFTGTPTAPTAAPGTNNAQIATTAFVLANLPDVSSYITKNYADGNYKPASYSPDLSGYVTSAYANNNYKSIGYAPSWEEITSKPSFFSGSYTDLSNKPALFSGSYTDLTNKPTLFSGSYTDLSSKPDIPTNFAWFKDKLLDNVGETAPQISNSNAGSQLYIATNAAGGGYGEVDYFSIPGTTTSARGHHAFWTLNRNQGTSGGISLDFGSFGDNNAFQTGGPIAPGIVDHSPNVTQRVPVFDINTNTIYYRTPIEFASDLGYALGTGYAVLNGGNNFTGDQNITGSITASGNITSTSDQRLKNNIKQLPNATEKLKNIVAVSYDRKDTKLHQTGLLAQNLKEYYPDLVETGKDGFLSVNYSMFVSPLLKGWQEHEKRIEQLEKEVERLKKKLK